MRVRDNTVTQHQLSGMVYRLYITNTLSLAVTFKSKKHVENIILCTIDHYH